MPDLKLQPPPKPRWDDDYPVAWRPGDWRYLVAAALGYVAVVAAVTVLVWWLW